MSNEVARTLIVDDDRAMLMILQERVESLGHKTLIASNGQEAWDLIVQSGTNVDIVVIDREMPKMNGLQFVEKIKNNRDLKNIPVIMQTGSDKPEQIKEGIDAGVYYYLTKPIDENILESVLSAAVRESEQQKILSGEMSQHKKSFSLINSCRFFICDLLEAESLTCFVANCFPDPEKVVPGIAELLINSIEHGNLAIGYEEKTWLIKEGTWREEVLRRSLLPEHQGKKVEVIFKNKSDEYSLKIIDSGRGFNWKNYMDVDPSRAMDNHGRGIAQANAISFDKLIYNDAGNEVTAIINSDSDIEW
ncbi:hypothetical protein AB835_07975 [Candidatus Endobugula sertula]|uniref:Response regulatory domain-containing protein n=1 Tax=Candidatus Endobugula sertula TaxID=62101 RepID=A0A1D2QQ22_9GAMM|nr:hypothetical protein AB835_07975 [Candidatus Endobugula sertula]